jgi:hypothetical protein
MFVVLSNDNAHQLRALKPAPAQSYASLAALTEDSARAESSAHFRPVGCMRGLGGSGRSAH